MATTLTKSDDEKIKSYQKQYAERAAAGASQSELNDIHSAAEYVRSQNGYSGGSDGSGYIPLSGASKSGLPNYVIAGMASSGTTASNAQSDYLNQLYAQKQTAALNSLKSAYEQNVTDLNTSAAKIPETYRTARNQTAATSAQNQAAFNERAAASGLNSGAGGQASLAIGNTLTNNLGALNKQEASSLADIETQRAKLNAQYQSQMAQVASDNNIALAQSLYNESVRAQNQSIDNQRYQDSLNANNLANQKSEYGNNIMAYYGDYQAEINNVLNNNDPTDDWKAQVLQAARNQKLLDLEEKAAKAAKTYSGGGSYSGSGSGTTGDTTGGGTVEFNSTAVDDTSPYGIITDIGNLRNQGYSSAQIKANAKAAYEAGQITAAQYQMYMQYSGSTGTTTTTGGGTR